MYESGNEEARPNLRSFVTLITAVTKSRRSDAAERAEKILFQMYDQFKQGNGSVKPNTIVVTAVIDCWQKSGHRNAGERAEALLDWLIELYEVDNDESLCPNEFSFSSGKSLFSISQSDAFFRFLSFSIGRLCCNSDIGMGKIPQIWESSKGKIYPFKDGRNA